MISILKTPSLLKLMAPVFLLVSLLAQWGCDGKTTVPKNKTTSTSALPPSNQVMAKELKDLAEAWDRSPFQLEEDKPFRANRPAWLKTFKARLEGQVPPREEIELRHKYGKELLWHGESLESQKQFERVFELALSWNLPPQQKQRLMKNIVNYRVIAYLRQAEQENCLTGHHDQSCLFPIEGRGVHSKPESARKAQQLILEGLKKFPRDPGAVWLLNLTAMVLGEYPDQLPERFRIPPKLFASEYPLKKFIDRAEDLKVATVGLAGGCALDDFNGDGRLDIVASSWGLRDGLRYYVQDAQGKFTDRSAEAGLNGELGGINLTHADYDNDGLLDLFILRGGWLEENGCHPNSLLRNLGDGRFENVTQKAGLLNRWPSHSAAWADFDLDGDLDLFVAHEATSKLSYPSILYRNRGDGTFEDATPENFKPHVGFVKGATWGDLDNDGDPDLYLSRAGEANALYLNEGPSPTGGGHQFKEIALSAGVQNPKFSFPTWFFDYDNDGWLDLFVAGFDGRSIDEVALDYLGSKSKKGKPRLYRNKGDGTFEDKSRFTEADRALLTMGANYGDLDNDGYLDFYLGTGAPDLRALLPNRMFRNYKGMRFQDVTTSGGFGHLQKGHGIAFSDIDNDGDQDIYAVMGGWFTGDGFPNALFMNPGNDNRWVTLRLKGKKANSFAVGARIMVEIKEGQQTRKIYAQVTTGGSYGAGSHQVELGLGLADSIEKLEIRWPHPEVEIQHFQHVPLDKILQITEGQKEFKILKQGGK